MAAVGRYAMHDAGSCYTLRTEVSVGRIGMTSTRAVNKPTGRRSFAAEYRILRIVAMKLAHQVSFVLLEVAIFYAASAQAFEPKVGTLLPDFTLPRIGNGEPVSLSDYRGRKVLLVMFASW